MSLKSRPFLVTVVSCGLISFPAMRLAAQQNAAPPQPNRPSPQTARIRTRIRSSAR